MKAVKKCIFPILLIGVFVLVMTTGSFLKEPFNKDDDVLFYLENIDENIQTNSWNLAVENMDLLISAWDKVKFRIQFSVEKERLLDLDEHLAFLKGAILAKNNQEVIVYIEVINKDWENLSK